METKFDKIGCFIQEFGALVSDLDRFADAEGNVKIKDFDTALKLFGLLYSRLQGSWQTCLGKEFEIKIEGPMGKVIEAILALLPDEDPKPA